MNTNITKLFAAGVLSNFSVRDATGAYVAVIQAPNIDVASERVSAIASVIEGGIVTPVTLARHEGSVHWPWFSENYFSTI